MIIDRIFEMIIKIIIKIIIEIIIEMKGSCFLFKNQIAEGDHHVYQ